MEKDGREDHAENSLMQTVYEGQPCKSQRIWNSPRAQQITQGQRESGSGCYVPLPESSVHLMALLIVDLLTKGVKLIPMSDAKADQVASAFMTF